MYKNLLVRNSLIFLGMSFFINSCGGGQSVPGGSAKGFYSMSLNLDNNTIVSLLMIHQLGQILHSHLMK